MDFRPRAGLRLFEKGRGRSTPLRSTPRTSHFRAHCPPEKPECVEGRSLLRLWRGSIAVVVFPSLMGCVFLYKLLTLSVPQILGSPAFLPAGGLKATREGWGRGHGAIHGAAAGGEGSPTCRQPRGRTAQALSMLGNQELRAIQLQTCLPRQLQTRVSFP